MHTHPQSTCLKTDFWKMLSMVVITCFTIIGIAHSKTSQNASLGELSIELSAQAQEAVNQGVLLTIDCEFASIKSILLFNFISNEKKHRFTLSRHTLSNRYIVKRDNLNTPHMFRSISEATNYITAQSLLLLKSYTTYDSERKMRLSLNKFELPGPLRLQAFLQKKWDLDTGWLAWKFES